MGGAIVSVPVNLGVGVIAGSRTAVIPEFSVANTEWVSGAFVVNTAGIMGFLSHQAWKSITGAGAAVHGSNGATGLCIIVHHGC